MAKRISKKKPPGGDNPFIDYSTNHGFDRVLLFGRPATAESDDDLEVPHDVGVWLDALEAFDAGDKSSLVNLPKSGKTLPIELLPHIGDLLDRWDIKKPPHKMRFPSYRITPDELKMSAACVKVADKVGAGLDLDVALVDVATENDVAVAKLREYYGKRRGPDRRARARKYDAKRRRRGD